MRTLTEIWIYPVKSLAGIPLSEAVVERAGLALAQGLAMCQRALGVAFSGILNEG